MPVEAHDEARPAVAAHAHGQVPAPHGAADPGHGQAPPQATGPQRGRGHQVLLAAQRPEPEDVDVSALGDRLEGQFTGVCDGGKGEHCDGRRQDGDQGAHRGNSR